MLSDINLSLVREKKRAYDRAYAAKHRDKRREANKIYRLANPEKIKAKSKAWRLANIAHVKSYNKQRYNIRRNRNLSITYGISLNEWNSLFAAQNFCCAACLATDPRSKIGWHTDHKGPLPCTKLQIRGILCARCNHAVGQGTAEDINRLQSVIKYIGIHL